MTSKKVILTVIDAIYWSAYPGAVPTSLGLPHRNTPRLAFRYEKNKGNDHEEHEGILGEASEEVGVGSLLVASGEEDRNTEERRGRESVGVKDQSQVEVVQEVQAEGVCGQEETHERQEEIAAVQQQEQEEEQQQQEEQQEEQEEEQQQEEQEEEQQQEEQEQEQQQEEQQEEQEEEQQQHQQLQLQLQEEQREDEYAVECYKWLQPHDLKYINDDGTVTFLGQGAFSDVLKAVYNGMDVVVKRFKVSMQYLK